MDFHPKKLFYFFFNAIASRLAHDVEEEVEDDEVEVILFF